MRTRLIVILLLAASLASAQLPVPGGIGAGSSGSGGGSGTVNSGTTPRLSFFPSTGTAVDDTERVEFDATNFGIQIKDAEGDVVARLNSNLSLFSSDGLTENLRIVRDALRLQSGFTIRWSSTTAWNGTADAGICRPSAGVLNIYDGTTCTTLRDIAARSLLVGTSLFYEGTADDFETTVSFTDPTADRAIVFPDAGGTVAMTSDTTRACPATFDGTNNPDELDGSAAALTYGANLKVLVTSTADIQGPTVLSCGAGGLKPIYKFADGTELQSGDWLAGDGYELLYEPTWGVDGAFHLLSLPATPYKRVNDAPALHADTHAAGASDVITPAAIGAAPLLTGANPTALSIVSGAVTVGASGGNNTIDTESDAASDDLTTLNCPANTMFLFRPESDARTVVLKANLAIGIEADRPMDQDGDHAVFFCATANAPVLLAFIDEDDVVYANGFAIGPSGGPSLAELLKFDFVFAFSNGGSELADAQARWIDVPNGCLITEWIIEAQPASSSVVFDVWMDTGANFPPTIADTIVASAKPTLSSGVRATSTTLTGWTTQTVENNVLMAVVESATTTTHATLRLRCTIN